MSSNYQHVRQWRQHAKERLVQAFGSKCAICGLMDDAIVYDFHHKDPSQKDFQISGLCRSWKTLVIEAQKCVMLCSHCHRKLHASLVVLPVELPTLNTDIYCVPKSLTDICPVCGKEKESRRKTCSSVCAGSQKQKVKWNELDLTVELQRHGSFVALASHLGVSDAALHKQYRKRYSGKAD